MDARTILGSRQGKGKGAESITLDKSVLSYSFTLPMVFLGTIVFSCCQCIDLHILLERVQFQKAAEKGVDRKLFQDEKCADSEPVGQVNSIQVLYTENNIYALVPVVAILWP